jgi:hypothetical protein
MDLVKSANGKTLAIKIRVSDYREEIRGASGSLLGYFSPKEGPEGKTHDASGRVIGQGDQLARFIPDER